jgi:2-C-methyl-D-erythritol 4-phosphate cytidylyltransferase
MTSAAAVAAIIPAAGSGTRLGETLPKALVEIDGVSLLTRSALTLSAFAGLIVVAAPPGHLVEAAAAVAEVDSEVHVVAGGDDRQQSVANALAIVPDFYTYVLVHDAARAFIPEAVCRRVIDRLEAGAQAVVPTMPVVDTVRPMSGDELGAVINRDELARIQTPQGFRREVIAAAYGQATRRATDDAALVADLGIVVHSVQGSERAFKVTTADDLVIAQVYARGEQ